MGKVLLKVREAAEVLNVGERKTRELGQRGQIEVVRLGTRTVRYTRKSVERLARTQQDDNGQE